VSKPQSRPLRDGVRNGPIDATTARPRSPRAQAQNPFARVARAPCFHRDRLAGRTNHSAPALRESRRICDDGYVDVAPDHQFATRFSRSHGRQRRQPVPAGWGAVGSSPAPIRRACRRHHPPCRDTDRTHVISCGRSGSPASCRCISCLLARWCSFSG
jgi:hypothetical protein